MYIFTQNLDHCIYCCFILNNVTCLTERTWFKFYHLTQNIFPKFCSFFHALLYHCFYKQNTWKSPFTAWIYNTWDSLLYTETDIQSNKNTCHFISNKIYILQMLQADANKIDKFYNIKQEHYYEQTYIFQPFSTANRFDWLTKINNHSWSNASSFLHWYMYYKSLTEGKRTGIK